MKRSEKNELISKIAYFEKKLNELPNSIDTFGFHYLGTYITKYGAERQLSSMKSELSKSDKRKLTFKIMAL